MGGLAEQGNVPALLSMQQATMANLARARWQISPHCAWLKARGSLFYTQTEIGTAAKLPTEQQFVLLPTRPDSRPPC